ncbi:MAG TPA: hypothetical protein VJS42_14885 [Steroidobacteraceae bacterium]|nr:hypothetical protein [Steroidobacteraceae bacterium]
MTYWPRLLCAFSLAASTLVPVQLMAAEIDARPPDKLTLTANGAKLVDVDEGGGGSLSWLHYFTPDTVFGLGAEHQFIADSKWTFGSVRGSMLFGQPGASRFGVFGELNAGDGDEDGRDFNYGVAALGVSQSFGTHLSAQLESRQIEVDTSHGNLPKLTLSYLWSPRLSTTLSYANSVGGNIGTELTTGRVDVYAPYVNFFIGGATGSADPVVLNLQPGVTLPVSNIKEGFFGIGKTFKSGELQLVGDYLESGESEKVTVTLAFTAYLGSRGR